MAIVSPAVLLTLDARPSRGPLWPQATSREAFRRVFARVVKRAKLRGPFKTLRKSSGTEVERLHPGKGHEHLGNSRQIFEKHYLDPAHDRPPLSPPPLG